MNTFSIIKDLCQKNGISVLALENAIGEPQSSISKSNSNMKAEKLYKIASYFHVSMESIMGREDIVTREPAASSVPISGDTMRIIDKLHSLDEIGQKKVEDYIDDIISSGRYKKVQALDA